MNPLALNAQQKSSKEAILAKARPTITKRLREKARLEKRLRKAERKAEREAKLEEEREELLQSEEVTEGDDPDLAGIVPGPQKPIWMDGDY